MPDFSRVSCKAVITIVPNNNTSFFEKIKPILLLGSSAESPIIIKEWLSTEEESILSYSGIIVLINDAINRYSDEGLAVVIEYIMPIMTGVTESPLSEQKILLCTDDNMSIIKSFCDLHILNMDILTNKGLDVSDWPVLKEHVSNRITFRPSKRQHPRN